MGIKPMNVLGKKPAATNFPASVFDVSNSAAESYESQMAALNNAVYLTWQEGNRGSNHTIAFSKSTTFVPEFGPLASIALLVSLIAIIGISSRSRLKLNL